MSSEEFVVGNAEQAELVFNCNSGLSPEVVIVTSQDGCEIIVAVFVLCRWCYQEAAKTTKKTNCRAFATTSI